MTTQQKPRIRLINNLWHCAIPARRGMTVYLGIGYTPAQAYEDWKKGRAQ